MTKNIVIFSDGTGQDGGVGCNTNVYKLFNMIEDRTGKQVSFYDRGLGTGTRKFLSAAAGFGISQNIKECYQFLFENYQAGDQIYLFGFSRGATTVRSLSGFIHMFGILPKSRPELIDQAYAIYQMSDSACREKKAGAFIERHHTMWTRIKFVGVWDTVAALGVPFKSLDFYINLIPGLGHTFHNLQLSDSVVHARHALALDDERLTFHPSLWDKTITDEQTLKQVWFCGVHTDVGGGYEEQGLADEALQWMLRESVEQGLLIYAEHKISIKADVNDTMHDSRDGFFERLYRKKSRGWNVKKYGNPVIHKSVLARKKNQSNTMGSVYDSWVLSMDYEIEQ